MDPLQTCISSATAVGKIAICQPAGNSNLVLSIVGLALAIQMDQGIQSLKTAVTNTFSEVKGDLPPLKQHHFQRENLVVDAAPNLVPAGKLLQSGQQLRLTANVLFVAYEHLGQCAVLRCLKWISPATPRESLPGYLSANVEARSWRGGLAILLPAHNHWKKNAWNY